MSANSTITNGADAMIGAQMPYTLDVTIEGTSRLLLHAWNNEAVAEKASAKKGSSTKKTDDLESYIHRQDGIVCLPSEYIRQSMIKAAKNHSDPRSPRKSLMDLCKASIICEQEFIPIISGLTGLTATTWDSVDSRRVVIQRAAITRNRPTFQPGYRATVQLTVLVPEYFDEHMIRELLSEAGRFVGIGDFRPTFGRFDVVHVERVKRED